MFPLEFPFVRCVSEPPSGGTGSPFVIGAMMTESHASFGERLRASCRAHGLPLALFEVPVVHRSITPKGADDPRFTKANFIRFLQERYGRAVLYLDADCVIMERPTLILEFARNGVDFAIFNWFAEEHTEAYKPVPITVQDANGGRVTQKRFYGFSHSIDWWSDSQMLCSGAVQWYANTPPAQALLAAWHAVIQRAPGRADDHCLDFTFNNWSDSSPAPKSHWLPKAYARYAWWIYEKPIIDHPDIPHTGDTRVPIEEFEGRRRLYPAMLQARLVNYVFARETLIDTETRRLFRLRDGAWQPAGTFSLPLWI